MDTLQLKRNGMLLLQHALGISVGLEQRKKGNTFRENLWCQGKMDVMGFHSRAKGPYKGYDKLVGIEEMVDATNLYMSTNFSEVHGCIQTVRVRVKQISTS